MMENNVLLRAENICKQFNGIPVLKNVDLEIRRGEVHALMGENGAGKSTIIKIITGVYTKDDGQIFMEGEPVEINSRQDARKTGIAVIYQELSLVPALSVVENIFLGQELTQYGFSSRNKMRVEVQALIDRLGFDIDPDAIVETMSMAKRQMVEILKALLVRAKIIIMDEPTSSLSPSEQEILFDTIRLAKKDGASILYISHRLDEIIEVADRLTVMRDGENVGVLDKEEISPQTVVPMMLGKEVSHIDVVSDQTKRIEENRLEVHGLSYKALLKDVNFTAYGGEVLGIGGLVGSGRTELLKCIYGCLKQDSGTVTLNGVPVSKSVGKNLRNGFAYVPEDRRSEGFIPTLSIERNLALASYDRLAPRGLVLKKREAEWAVNAIKNYDIRPPMKELPVANLSGGNQQKVVVARGLARSPKVLLLDEPTAGIDVGVKAELYQIIRDLAASGTIVVMVSSDLAELRHVSDRILVMYKGRFFEEFTHERVTQNAILLAASGVHTEEGKAL
jgi:ribose transport system ATP-binding protein